MAFDPNTDTGPTNQGGNADFLKQLSAALAAVGGGIGGRALANSQGNPLTSAVPPQMSQLLDQSVARQAYQNPLFQATTQGVYDMLPDFAKNGTQLSGTLSNQVQPPTTGGSGGPGLGTAAGLGGASALAALLARGGGPSSGGELGKIFDAIKKLFHRKPGQPVNDGSQPSNDPNPDGFQFDPFAQGYGMDQNRWPGNEPAPNVNTDEFLGQWPETGDPFSPFDPNTMSGGGGADDNSFGWKP